ncbi:MAG: hypothetical protein HY558_03535 [Euryarchaeota archaeon]|nr:hypothetical protein [Euryarchaeota archaeon]
MSHTVGQSILLSAGILWGLLAGYLLWLRWHLRGRGGFKTPGGPPSP